MHLFLFAEFCHSRARDGARVGGCGERKGRSEGGKPSYILPSSRPEPAPLAGQGRRSLSHQLRGCCAGIVKTVADILFLTLPAKPAILSPKAQFPTTLGPSTYFRPEISETPVIPKFKVKANINRPTYIKGENLVQMLSRQERRLVGRGQASSSRNVLVMINMGTRSSDERLKTVAAMRLDREQERRGLPQHAHSQHSGCCLWCKQSSDERVVITQRKGTLHISQIHPGSHC